MPQWDRQLPLSSAQKNLYAKFASRFSLIKFMTRKTSWLRLVPWAKLKNLFPSTPSLSPRGEDEWELGELSEVLQPSINGGM